MTKSLNGRDLADFIKERQAKQVRTLRQAHEIFPKLAIITRHGAGNVTNVYLRMKQAYGEDILIETQLVEADEKDMVQQIEMLNVDKSVHGIIVQLPLSKRLSEDEVSTILNSISPEKDVDGLGSSAEFISATAEAIDWLLAGYAVELKEKLIVIVGSGRLIGAPLSKLWLDRGLDVTTINLDTADNESIIKKADVLVSCAGSPNLIFSSIVKPAAVVVDAGTSSDGGTIIGDVANDVRERSDVIITPEKGGVGPLTIGLVYDHVIQAAQATVKT